MFNSKMILGLAFGLLIGSGVITPSPCHPGDAAELEIIGFSVDGKYFAFEQYGNMDGSGAAYSWIDFYDVGGGRYVDETKRIVVGGREGHSWSLEQTRSEARKQATETLERLSVPVGNVGKRVVSRPLNDLGADSTSAQFSVWTPLEGMISQDYSLELETSPTTTERCYFDEPARVFDLYLIDNGSGEKILLHHDDYLPEERGCAVAYRIADVAVFEPFQKRDVSGTSIVVLLNIFSTGFEGHDMRYTAVGGTLK